MGIIEERLSSIVEESEGTKMRKKLTITIQKTRDGRDYLQIMSEGYGGIKCSSYC